MPPYVRSERWRNMGVIASVSRSSGLDKDGDTLKDVKIQEEYREYINEKVNTYWNDHHRNDHSVQRGEAQTNLLILFRKLREGLMSSKRVDSFAIEVYETSLRMAVLFQVHTQVTSILSSLLPELYLASDRKSSTPEIAMDNRRLTTLISLLHDLISDFPSQTQYWHRLNTLPPSFLPRDSTGYLWISSLSSALRFRNYIKLEKLSRTPAFSDLLLSSSEVAHDAFYVLVEALRDKARLAACTVFRSAYREISSHPLTVAWLQRLMLLEHCTERGSTVRVEDWLEDMCREEVLQSQGEVEPKKWLVRKIRA